MKFNSNKQRRAYWMQLHELYSAAQMEAAFGKLKPDCLRVLKLHYYENYSLKEITALIERSITVVRNHHNRGIHKLYRHFNPRTFETV